MKPVRGEVWLFDLGMEGKIRPALVVSAAYGDLDRTLVTILPHTTSVRGSQFEIPVKVSFLKPGAFLVQNVATYPDVRAIRKLGILNREQFNAYSPGCFAGLGTAPEQPAEIPAPAGFAAPTAANLTAWLLSLSQRL